MFQSLPVSMTKFSSTISNQIRFLLQSMDGTNFDSVFQQLCQFTEYGTDGCILLLRTCMDHMQFYDRSLKDMQKEPALAAVFKYLLDKPNFCTVLSESLKTTEISEQFLENLCNALELTTSEKIGVGLAMSDSANLEIRLSGKNFCMGEIEELCGNPMSLSSSEKIQNIIFFLQHSDSLSKHLDSFMQMVSLMQSKETTPFILTPYLSEEMREAEFLRNVDLLLECGESDFDSILADIHKEISVGDIMKELGYGCTANKSQCIEFFSLFLPLTESTVAKVLGAIARTHTGLEENYSAFITFTNAMDYSNLSELPPLSSWNIEVLIDTIRHLAAGTNWLRVIENLDHEGFYIPSEEAFSFFMSVYKHACKDPFPLHAICGSVWKNSEGQLSFLKYAVSSPPEVFTFAHATRKLAYVDATNGPKLQIGHANHAWLCLDLLDILCQLAERGHASFVRSMLDYPLKNCPEVLLLGMAQINTVYNLLQYEVSYTAFPIITKSTGRGGMILYLWHTNPSLMLREVSDSVNNDPDSIIRIFDICQEIKILPSVLEMVPSSVGIKLAAVASRSELLDIENWLSHNVTTYKGVFFEECLKFLKDIEFCVSQNFSGKTFHYPGDLLNIFVDATSSILKVLQAYNSAINSSHLSEELEKLQQTFASTSAPRLQNGGATDSSSTDGYGDDIEAEANSYFHQVFSGEVTVDTMVQMLSRFKESSIERERSISDCMIANLFEEYRFFPKYPEKQLKITALLFGSLIKNQLVTHLPLGIALRCVIDSLRKPADSKMFLFGTLALEQFMDRLIEWPQYCNHILQISHLRSTHPEIVSFIEQALARISLGHGELDGPNHGSNVSNHISSAQGGSGHLELHTSSVQTAQPLTSLQPRQENIPDELSKISAGSSNDVKHNLSSLGQPTTVAASDTSSIQKAQNTVNPPAMLAPSPGFVRSSRGSSARFGSALNIETLVAAAVKRETPIEAPASEVQDKISFIINNLSAANIEAKAKEFVEIIKGQYYPWFAEYMVMKRASIEPNFHDLYLKFLDKVNSKALNKEIVQATYENCKVLLGSELIKSSSEERSLLKNLGSWLGKLTIGRNQVLRAREIDPKSLIIEAYEKGLMIAVIPFTSKILEPCQNSLAYQPPNPWTMGILGLLAEIYSMPNLKMNLKFDIEVLFKHLGVDMKEVAPTSLLKDRKREIEGNPDFSNKDLGASQTQMISEIKPAPVPPTNQVDLPLDVNNANNGGQTHVLSQYPPHLPNGSLVDEEKIAALDQLPSVAGLLPNAPSPSPFSVSQLPTPIANIGTHVVINQKLTAFGLYVHFQRAVPIAMDRAIKEIVASIVQRSVSIATRTTKELVLKDYAMESDETRIFNAAHLMVASLAGSLAHVTCKEPLRGSISSQLRDSFQGLHTASELLEQAVQLVTNDNLDLGCAVIEQAATDKAIQTIDGEIAQHLTLRRKNREGMGPSFFDSNLYTQGSMGGVPEALRPKPGHLSLSQQRVYEDFVRLPWQNQSSQSSHALPVGPSTPSGSTSLSSGYGPVSTPLLSGYSTSLGSTGFEGASRSIDDTIDLNSASNYSASSIHVRSTDAVLQHVSENDSVMSSFPSAATTPELHPVDASDSVQDLQPFPSPVQVEIIGSNASEPPLTTRDALDKYQMLEQKLEALINNDPRDSEIQAIISEVPEIILRCVSRDEAALAIAQKVFKGLYDNAPNSIHVGAHLAILTAIRDVCKLAVKELTSWVIYSEDERKFNKDITIGFIRSELLNLAEYNVHMAKLIDGGRNKAAIEFSISLLQALLIEESKVISELQNLVDALAQLATKPGSPESLQQLIEIVKNPTASVSILSGGGKDDKTRQARDKKITGLPPAVREEYNVESIEQDPAGFREQVSTLFADWYRICELPGSNDVACAHYVLQLHQNGFLKGDDVTDHFFRILMELSVAHCLSSEMINAGGLQSHQPIQNLSFLAIDIYAKLVYFVLKGSTKPFLLSKILAGTVKFILKEAEEKKASFNPRPFFRLFINWLLDLGTLEPIIDGANFQMLTSFANAFHALQPLKVPLFSFVWLELISHKSFMPKMLTGNGQKGWPYIQRLLVDLFQFMEPFLRNAELGVPVNFLYKGTLRVLLVLLHDFPEFLCDYHFTFCDVIPPSCIQMRNIILSAFPRNMRLPDPSTPNLKIDLLQEITQSPRILSEVDVALKAKHLKADIDEYLKTRQQGTSFLSDLKQKLLLSTTEAASAGTRYNVPLINSVVLYVGMQAIQQLQARTQLSQTTPNTFPLAVLSVGAALEIFQTLMIDLDTEGRYLFLNAAANQLRYPNTHTHYFSFILLYLFSEANQEIIQEQITRVLLERLIVNRPHPWGLLITFIELIKNPRYNFWNRGFIRCAPEIEKLFESVSRSCGGPKPVDDSMVSSWVSDGPY